MRELSEEEKEGALKHFVDCLSNKPLEDRVLKLQDRIYALRQLVWELDIPRPTTVEYIELHEKMQKIIQYIDDKLLTEIFTITESMEDY